jgi:hypothetical protein
MAPGISTPKEESMCLLLPRGTLEKWVLTAPPQAQKEKRERGLCGACRHWADWWLGLTWLFPPWPPRAHGLYVGRGPTCRFYGGHWCWTFGGDLMGRTKLKIDPTRLFQGQQGPRPAAHFSSPENILWEGILWLMSFSIYQNVQWHWWAKTC